MKRFIYLVSIVSLISLILSACNIPFTGEASTPAPTEEPTIPDIATEAPATLVPIDLAGPVMAVGSKYPYVDGTILVGVPGGTFIMGYNGEDNPVHEVTVGDFWIYSTKVTNSQYSLCVASGKCIPPDEKNNPLFGDLSHANYPVTGVNYEQATQYCSFVNGKLPTEAQWEKTARGPEGNIFPWGDEAPACNLSNYLACVGKITPINEYEEGVSFYSAFDMAGNAREWVLDWYSPFYYSVSPTENPLGPELGEKRSVRGSSYQDGADSALAAHRFSLNPIQNLPDLGFRCVVGDPTYFAPACEQVGFIGTGPNGEEANCTPNLKCNNVSVSQAPLCTPRLVPYTIVTFNLSDNPPDGWSYDVPGCSQISGEDKFVCNPEGPYTATVEGSCDGTNTCQPSCAEGYVNENGVCTWKGGETLGTQCLPGSTYDPLTQCCSATPGTTTSYDLCPAGYFLSDGVCYADSSFTKDKESLNVVFNSCEPPKDNGGGGGPSCTLTCPMYYKVCATTCTCELDYMPCP